MILMFKWKPPTRILALAAGVAFLTACAAPQDDLTNSRLTQQPPGSPIPPPTEAGDIAVAGQYAAHAIMDLPEVANATTPPLVQFTGVTSIITTEVPIDTEPYTELLRDRLVLITREKLRFIERQLPPLVVTPAKKSHKKAVPAAAPETSESPDYQLLAELHGRYKDDFYKVQIQFVDIHTGAVLYNGLYRIGKEVPQENDTAPAPADATAAPPPDNTASPAPPPGQDPSQPTPTGMTQ